MLRQNALGITRAIGCLWLAVAAFAGLLAIWNVPLLIWWPVGLAVMGLLAINKTAVPARLFLVVGALATAFAIWVASGSTAGTENAALLIGALSAALAIASASARTLLEPVAAPSSRDIQQR